MKRIALGTAASVGLLFILSIPISSIAIYYATEIAKHYEPVGDIKLVCEMLVVYIAILYYTIGFNLVRESIKLTYPYRKKMIIGYGFTVVFKIGFLLYYLNILFKYQGIFYAILFTVIYLVVIIVPILLGKWVSDKLSVNTQKIVFLIPIVLSLMYVIVRLIYIV